MNSEEIHLKSWSNKIQEKKCTKCFYVHKHSEAILQAFFKTLQYNDNGVVFFSFFRFRLCTIDQASFSYTMQ